MSIPIILSVSDEYHFTADTVDNEGGIAEEVVADHAFGRDGIACKYA